MAHVDEINLAFDYSVSDAPVTMTIKIGNAQIGGSVLEMDGQVIGTPGDVTNVVIGKTLAGKSLLSRTLVADISKKTNWTSVTYTLAGGANHPPFTFSHEVANDGDAARYATTINFVK